VHGTCLPCAETYDPKLPAGANPPLVFYIDFAALVDVRGRDCHIIGMRTVPCSYCGSRRTELRFLPPMTGDGDAMHSANDGSGA
jgi:hypothetical protein